jgi:hypothetical protein
MMVAGFAKAKESIMRTTTRNGTNVTDITGMMVVGFAKAKESIMRTTTRNGTNVTDITGMMVVGIVKARESINKAHKRSRRGLALHRHGWPVLAPLHAWQLSLLPWSFD